MNATTEATDKLLTPSAPAEPSAHDGLLTTRQAAKFLNVSERTLWAITDPRGSLRRVKIIGRVLYDPADLRQYIESCKG